ncbi:acetyltransferase [Yersinia similis]|nr:acetyltransferase [Yersinia similis]
MKWFKVHSKKVGFPPLFRLLTNPDDSILNGEDRQRSKASAPRMARLEPTWMYLRRLYDLPVLSVAGTLSITSKAGFPPPFYLSISPVSDTEKGNNTNIHNDLVLLLRTGKSGLLRRHHLYSSLMGSYRYPIS